MPQYSFQIRPRVEEENKMTKIKEYQNRDGEKRYQFNMYIGINSETGKAQRTTRRGFTSRKEAKLALSRLELQVSEYGFKAEKKPKIYTFEDVYEMWFVQYKNTVKESSWATTQRIFRLHILPVFGKYRVEKITVPMCQQAVNKWFIDGLRQYHRFLNYAGKVLKYSITMQLITSNPVEGVIIPRQTDDRTRQNIENYYNKQELEHFFECLKDDDQIPQAYVFFRLAAFSGMRKSEMLALKWSDVNFKDCSIDINKTQSRGAGNRLVIQSPKTARSRRTAYIDPKTAQILRNWQKEQQKFLGAMGFPIGDNLIFANEKNEMFQPVKPQVWLKHVIGNYDLKKVTVHAFRHTYATLSFESGASVKAVQEQLGHSSYKTTMDIYTATTRKESNEATEKLAKYLNF